MLANDIAKLITFFSDNDMDVDAVHYDVDRSNEEGWQSEWLEYAEDAGLKGKSPGARADLALFASAIRHRGSYDGIHWQGKRCRHVAVVQGRLAFG